MSQFRSVSSAVFARQLCSIYFMASRRIPLGFPNATGTPATDGIAEGSRSLAQTAIFLTAKVRTVNVGEFVLSQKNIRQRMTAHPYPNSPRAAIVNKTACWQV